MLYAKLHGVICTEANINYVGSITLDETWCKMCGLYENQKVDVVNVTTGARLTTYVIYGPPGKGDACLNGAAAHLFSKGDKMIIMAYVTITKKELASHKTKVLFFTYPTSRKSTQPTNPIVSIKTEHAFTKSY